MQCPRCGHDDDKVIDSRAVREGRAVRSSLIPVSFVPMTGGPDRFRAW